jgi:hypothetical protein
VFATAAVPLFAPEKKSLIALCEIPLSTIYTWSGSNVKKNTPRHLARGLFHYSAKQSN